MDEETKLRNGQTAKVGGKGNLPRACAPSTGSTTSHITIFLKPSNHTPTTATTLLLSCGIPKRSDNRSQERWLAPDHTLIHTNSLYSVAINLHKYPWGH